MPIKDNVSQAATAAKWRADQQMRLMKANQRISELQGQLEKQKLALAEEALKAQAPGVTLPEKSAGLRVEIEQHELKASELRAQHEKLVQEQAPQADEHSGKGKLAHAASVAKWKAQQQIMMRIVHDKVKDVENHIHAHKSALGSALLEEWGTALDAAPALHEAWLPIQATEAELAEQRKLHEAIKAETPPAPPAPPVAAEALPASEAPAALATADVPAATDDSPTPPTEPPASEVPAPPPAG